MNALYERIQPRVGTITLRHVEEFCACFAAATIRHDLTFRHAGDWQAARAVVDAAERSGLALVALEFRLQSPEGLRLSLEGGARTEIAALWWSILALPGVVLVDWQSSAAGVASH